MRKKGGGRRRERGSGCDHSREGDREIQREREEARESRNRGRRQEKKDDFSPFLSKLSL